MGKDNLMWVLTEVVTERDRQDTRWGEQNHQDTRYVHDEHNVAERRMAVLRTKTARENYTAGVLAEKINWSDILNEEVCEALEEAAFKREERLREELIQVAAVAVAWIQAIDRRTAETKNVDLTQLRLPF